MDVRIAPEVHRSLRGAPVVGSAEAVISLLTVDDDGSPHVCLLSRAQADADSAAMRLVVSAGGTAANLDRDRRGCLVVVTDGAAYYCQLEVDRRLQEGRLVGYLLRQRGCKRDAVTGSDLRPMTYHVTPEMPQSEDWPATRRLLTALG